MPLSESVIENFLSCFGAQSLIVPLKERNKSETAIPVTPKTLKPESVAKTFGAMNEYGDYALYFLVNESNHPTQRKLENITRCRAIWIEDDSTGDFRTDFPIPPNLVVNSSPGKYHYYWITDTTNTEEHQRVMQHLVDDYNCDPNARDLSRVMRIPGTYHLKKDKFKVTYVDSTIPAYSWEEIKKAFPPTEKVVKVNQDKSGKFDKDSAAAKIESTENYHETLRDLAMRYANIKQLSREEIATMLRGYMEAVPADKRDERWQSRNADQHIYECVDSAMKKVASESDVDKNVKAAPKLGGDIPAFPEHLFAKWPDPWPDIWESFNDMCYDPVPAMLATTMISTMGFMLGGKYVTARKRRPQFSFLNLCQSTGRKDTNSTEVINSFAQAYASARSDPSKSTLDGIADNPFMRMKSFPDNVTADTSFMESFDDQGNFYWKNTEATRIYQGLSVNKTNASAMAVSDKIIQVVDGGPIAGKAKSGKEMKNIVDPNCQVLFFAQPETITKYLSHEMIDSGLFGRANIVIVPDEDFDISTYDRFTIKSPGSGKLDPGMAAVFLKIYASHGTRSEKVVIEIPKDKLDWCANWWRETDTVKMMTTDGDLQKVHDRHALFTEQLYTIIKGVCMAIHGDNHDEIKLEYVMPLVEYWCDCKTYAMKHFINTSHDPLSDKIMELVANILAGEMAVSQKAYKDIIATEKVVPAAVLKQFLSRQKKFLNSIEVGPNGLSDALVKSLRSLCETNFLVKVLLGNKTCYGLPKTA